jgi:hypothetical protein
MRLLCLVGCGGLLLGLAGCGQGDPKLAPVRGRVYYRGDPLPGGTIVFTPDPGRGGHGPLAYAEIESDGRYFLRTGQEVGAVPGWHRVTVAPAGPAGDAGGKPVVALPRKYTDPEQSGETCEVKEGQVNTCDLHLD